MTKIFSALAASVNGFITGRNPVAGRGLGDGGVRLGQGQLWMLRSESWYGNISRVLSPAHGTAGL